MSKASAKWNAANKERNYRKLYEFFQTNPCMDCGETNPIVLQFDHRDNKSFGISNRIAAQKWETLLNEINKCDVRCANCHTKKTAIDRGYYWVKQWPELVE